MERHSGLALVPSARPVPYVPSPFGPLPGPRGAGDARQRIEGFASPGSVSSGQSLGLRVTVDPPQPFTVEIHRVGHYGGAGAARLTGSPPLPGLAQPAPLVADRTASCHHWWLSCRLPIPADWRSGAYVAVLTTMDGHRGHVPFTVRSERPADLLLLLPDLTWQAHNRYPADDDGAEAAPTTLSLDRPYEAAGLPPYAAHAYAVIRWAERQGYDLTCADASDLHAGRVQPTRYRGLVFPGPDELWSVPMRRVVERARDHGTSLVFLGAATLRARAELAASAARDPDRLLIRRGASWREAGGPEQRLLGVGYAGRVPRPAPLVVRNADHWLWLATGASEGDELPGLVAGHADRYFPRAPLPCYASRILLAHSPFRDEAGARQHQETSLYQAPSGAYVFASGTSAWAPALDPSGRADPRVQRATANLLDRVCGLA